MLPNYISEHLILKIFLEDMLPDPLAGLCLHTVECTLHTIVLLFVHTLIDQSIFQIANQISHWLVIMS